MNVVWKWSCGDWTRSSLEAHTSNARSDMVVALFSAEIAQGMCDELVG